MADGLDVDKAAERTPADISSYWQNQIDIAEKDHKEFIDNGQRVVEKYRSEKDRYSRGGSVRRKRMNILYSNTELLLAALYGKSATPDVRRRYSQEDPLGQQVSELIEAALVNAGDAYNCDKPIELALRDYLLPGRGIVRIDYIPTTGMDPMTGQEAVTDQIVKETYVYWKDFLHMPARTWADIEKNGWIGFRHTMTRRELVENFEDEGAGVPLNWSPDIKDRKDIPESLKKAEVWEIWDITDRSRTWIVKGHDRPLRVDDDPYGLENFFPTPEPPAYYFVTESIIPEPEYHTYKDQAEQLDELTNRIDKLTRALKRRGVYDQSIKELSRLATAQDNIFIPVENYQLLASKGGLQASFQSEDISLIATVLSQLYQQKQTLIQDIWQVAGIADIMRGQSDPKETLGAQNLKAQYGSGRLQRRQRAVQKWIRDLLKIKAELIAEHFEPQVLMQMTGQPVTPEMMQILRTDKLRSYRIDVETDSTIFEDKAAEQASRAQMIQAITAMIVGWGPIVAQQPVLVPLSFELLKFGLGSFKATRPIEDAIDQAQNVLEQRAQAGGFQAPPSAEMQKTQAEIQSRQIEAQTKQQEAQGRMALEQQKTQHDMALQQQKHEHDKAIAEQEMAHRHGLAQQEFARQQQLDRYKTVGDAMQQPAAEGDDGAPFVHPLEQMVQTIGAALAASQQQMQQMMAMVAQSNQQIAAAIQQSGAPRRRVAVRDHTGRIVEAHDVPMTVQ